MTENEKILLHEFELIKSDLINKHKALGMEASGKWINGLEIVQNALNIKIIGEPYTRQLVSGRPPSQKMPPIEALKQWIIDKGLVSGMKASSVTSFAWAIAKKIQKEGTRYYPEGTDLVEAVVTPQRIQSIIDKVGNQMVTEATETIVTLTREFQKIA